MVVNYFLRLELKTGRNFEAVQSYLGLFLKMHGETVAEEEVHTLIHLWHWFSSSFYIWLSRFIFILISGYPRC